MLYLVSRNLEFFFINVIFGFKKCGFLKKNTYRS